MNNKAILLINLGSPSSTKVEDVKTYLDEFLMDKRVIDIAYPLRYLLVRGIITRFRAPKSAEKYKSIWTDNGSPLIYYTQQLTKLLAKETNLPVYMCMRYAVPKPSDVMDQIQKEHPNLEELILFPLYPHYAMSSYETAVEHVLNHYKQKQYSFKINTIDPFYDDEDYINALSESIEPHLKKDYDHILFSYHGIPERHVKKSDITKKHCLNVEDCCNKKSEAHPYCYRHQVVTTSDLVAKKLDIPKEKYSICFQSRLGPNKWLEPSTEYMLQTLPKKGIKKLLIVCPAFVSDCLETLEEINMEGKETFEESGGDHLHPIPCLNENPTWISAMHKIINKR